MSPASRRLAIAVALGVVVALVVGLVGHNAVLGVLLGVTVMAGVFVVSTWMDVWPLSAGQTRDRARSEDFPAAVDEMLIVVVAVAAVATITAMLFLRESASRSVAAAVGLLGIFMVWAMLHVMYSTRYAHLYYTDPIGGIDFNNRRQAPSYRDFLYFGYNLGMTYQVSDTSVGDTRIRALVLRHCLLSYVFGTVILAATINLVAGLVTA